MKMPWQNVPDEKKSEYPKQYHEILDRLENIDALLTQVLADQQGAEFKTAQMMLKFADEVRTATTSVPAKKKPTAKKAIPRR